MVRTAPPAVIDRITVQGTSYMFKKILIGATIAMAAAIAVPTAANAAGYVPASSVTVTGSTTAGGTTVVDFAAGSFAPNETVDFGVSGATPVTLAAVGSQTIVTTTETKMADASGATSIRVTFPSNATGSYVLTAVGETSGNVATATFTVSAGAVTSSTGTVAATSSTGGLAFTGSTVPMALVWGASGALGLGIALVAVMSVVRRQRERV